MYSAQERHRTGIMMNLAGEYAGNYTHLTIYKFIEHIVTSGNFDINQWQRWHIYHNVSNLQQDTNDQLLLLTILKTLTYQIDTSARIFRIRKRLSFRSTPAYSISYMLPANYNNAFGQLVTKAIFYAICVKLDIDQPFKSINWHRLMHKLNANGIMLHSERVFLEDCILPTLRYEAPIFRPGCHISNRWLTHPGSHAAHTFDKYQPLRMEIIRAGDMQFSTVRDIGEFMKCFVSNQDDAFDADMLQYTFEYHLNSLQMEMSPKSRDIDLECQPYTAAGCSPIRLVLVAVQSTCDFIKSIRWQICALHTQPNYRFTLSLAGVRSSYNLTLHLAKKVKEVPKQLVIKTGDTENTQ